MGERIVDFPCDTAPTLTPLCPYPRPDPHSAPDPPLTPLSLSLPPPGPPLSLTPSSPALSPPCPSPRPNPSCAPHPPRRTPPAPQWLTPPYFPALAHHPALTHPVAAHSIVIPPLFLPLLYSTPSLWPSQRLESPFAPYPTPNLDPYPAGPHAGPP